MRRTFIAVAASLICGSVAVAATLPHSYRLKPGSKCRSGYVRNIRVKNRRKQVWCVEKPRIATTIHVLSSPDYTGGPGYNWSDSVSAEVAYDHDNNTLDGVPLRFAVVNDVTGKKVATFSGVANIYTSCSIVASLDSAGKTADWAKRRNGSSLPPEPCHGACQLGFSLGHVRGERKVRPFVADRAPVGRCRQWIGHSKPRHTRLDVTPDCPLGLEAGAPSQRSIVHRDRGKQLRLNRSSQQRVVQDCSGAE
jgi:hypothetical protein